MRAVFASPSEVMVSSRAAALLLLGAVVFATVEPGTGVGARDGPPCAGLSAVIYDEGMHGWLDMKSNLGGSKRVSRAGIAEHDSIDFDSPYGCCPYVGLPGRGDSFDLVQR